MEDTDSSSEDSMTDEPESPVDSRIKLKWKSLSNEVKSLIYSMTDPDPALRPSIAEVLSDEWIASEFSSTI
eukprot:CAMPEP_0168330132 /NCGR_PEP_ID=MMETSP0213-20121227/7531_1 /TAXON_ID=151035 /ORGANISM="Euplotes harpa, Strain FSP1.4" /LENGTH=70 /DNA_ID=CAMNT_0008333609 /DNA_START=662 /DNA_END=874 /DNA_ORIENTATION=+